MPKLKVGPVRSPKNPMFRVAWSAVLFCVEAQEGASAVNESKTRKISPDFSFRRVCDGANKTEIVLLKLRDLLTKVGFFNSRIGCQILRGSFHNDATSFQDVSAVRMFQRGVRVLFYQQDRCALTFDFINRFEDRMNNQGRQS